MRSRAPGYQENNVFRYVALAWNVQNENQCAAARLLADRLQARPKQWGRACDECGLCIFYETLRHGSLRACALPQQSGVLLGAAFQKDRTLDDASPASRFVPSREQGEQIVASSGRWLIEHVWGNYVAVMRDPISRRAWALKDPCGDLPCYLTSFRGVHVLFAHIADLLATDLFEFTANSRYLANRVLHGGVLDDDALNEVQRVYRGECVELGDERRRGARVFHWHPLRFTAANEPIEDVTSAARAMRATVRSCTHTLMREHQSALLRLSGGLDSSIIAACLGNVPERPELCCYTYYTPSARSDERPWARLAATRNGLQHEEHAVTAEAIPLPSVLNAPTFVEPIAVMGYIHRSTLEHQIAREHRASAVFCGDGGDSGLCGDTFAYAVSEHLRRRGVTLQAWHLAGQVASLTQESTWTVLLKSLRRWRRGAGMEHQLKMLLPASRLLSEELRASYSNATRFPHPWLSDLQPIPWALVRRLGALLAPPESHNVAKGARAPEIIAPLYSQPATELFLRIPLDVHFQDGRERGLARSAFAQDVPQEILRRTWKDRAPGFLDELVRRHRKFLRELLLDGVLVHEGLLNRDAVEDALSDRISTSLVFPGELLRHLDVEIWARQWPRSAGAAGGARVIA
jgi:asparagine synthase (glutamine-hydrolysing)